MAGKPSRPPNGKRVSPPSTGQHGLARVISKRGICSRSQAEVMVRAGRVSVDDVFVRDPETRTVSDARIAIDGKPAVSASRKYLMLNKPRGLVTTTDDEHGRDTVYALFKDAGLP
ncbi:S4 domain-containing protein, partial [Dokdonella sp.]|uniref:S4 domain-containing protein n=1 Tax=Dokdonella sp. TaxID=2291710 RepID=UPI003C4031A1